MKKLISIVSPCFNEEGNVDELCQRVRDVMRTLPQFRYEHILIDNASRDGTVGVLRRIAGEDPRVKVIVNSRNFGHVRSPMHAVYEAKGDAVAILLSDLQDPPELLREMILAWESGTPVVVGIKQTSEESAAMFSLRSLYYKLVAHLTDVEVFEHFTGFGVYDRKVIDLVRKEYRDPYPYFRGIIAEIGLPHKKFFYQQKLRRRGLTKNNFYTLYDLAMLGITSLSKVPLRLFIFLGLATSAVSLLVALFYLVYKLLYWNSFSVGIAPALIGLFFFMSVLMIGIGFLGEYIGAIHTMVQNRPLVVERERINFDAQQLLVHRTSDTHVEAYRVPT